MCIKRLGNALKMTRLVFVRVCVRACVRVAHR
jgi:hypothetical protein